MQMGCEMTFIVSLAMTGLLALAMIFLGLPDRWLYPACLATFILLVIVFHDGDGWRMSVTASHTSSAYSTSVPVYDSGEYSKKTVVPLTVSTCLRQYSAASVAIFLIPALSSLKTTRR